MEGAMLVIGGATTRGLLVHEYNLVHEISECEIGSGTTANGNPAVFGVRSKLP